MQSPIGIKLEGARELEAALSRMSRKAARSVVTKAVRKAQTPLRDAIRQRIKSELMTMNARARAEYSKQVGTSFRAARQGGVVGKVRTASRKVRVGNRVTNFAPLAHIFDGGAAPHKIKQKHRTIDHPGIRATPIWAMTFDKMKEKMAQDFMDYMFEQLASEWRRK